jgi:hypothetical protein
MMRPSESAQVGDERPLRQELLYALRYYLGGRRGLAVLAIAAVATGLAVNWGWLVAIGIAPLLVAALPCLAMCALGLCMVRKAGGSCAPEAGVAPTTLTSARPAGEARPEGAPPATSLEADTASVSPAASEAIAVDPPTETTSRRS